jgi:hypothetical protein
MRRQSWKPCRRSIVSALLPDGDRGVALEDAVGVEGFVEIVRCLGLLEPQVPVSDQLFLRQIAQIEILLTQELIAQVGHD